MSDSEDYRRVEAADGASDDGGRSRADSRDSQADLAPDMPAAGADADEKLIEEALEQVRCDDDAATSDHADELITGATRVSEAKEEDEEEEEEEEDDDAEDAEQGAPVAPAESNNGAFSAENQEVENALVQAAVAASLESTSSNTSEKQGSSDNGSAESSDCFTDGGSSASRFPGNSAFFSQAGTGDDKDQGDGESEWDSVSRFVEAQMPDMAAVNALLRNLAAGNTEAVFSPQNKQALVDEISGLGGIVENLVTAFNDKVKANGGFDPKGEQGQEAQQKFKQQDTQQGNTDNHPEKSQFAEAIAHLMDAFKHPHVVQAAQEFLYHPVITSLVVDVCKAGSNGESVQNAALAHLGDLLGALAQLVKAAPEVIRLVPQCMKILMDLATSWSPPCTKQPPQPTTAQDNNADVVVDEFRQVVHRHVICDGCTSREAKVASLENGHRSENGYIRGARWKSAIHEDFDLCTSCEASGEYEEKYAPFIKIKTPSKAPRDIVVVLRESSKIRPENFRQASTCSSTASSTDRAPSAAAATANRVSQAAVRSTATGTFKALRVPPHQHKCWRSSGRVTPVTPNLSCMSNQQQVKCPGGHVLREFSTPNTTFACDACDSHIPFAVLMHGCRECNFDLCLRCVGSQTKKQNKNQERKEQQQAQVSQDKQNEIAHVERPRAKFVADVSLPDGSILSPNCQATKTWRISNPGRTAWPTSVRLVHVGGALMGASNGISVPPLEPAAEFDLALPIQAPAQAGRYVGYWRLMYDEADSQRRFGHRLWCDISVATANAPPPPPPAPPAPPSPQVPAPYASELALLAEMGFNDEALNRQLLAENDFETTMVKLLQK
jgi:hypothetical protein